MKVICDNCGNEFNKKPSRLAKTKHNFCCHECHDKFRHETRMKELSDKVGMNIKNWLYIEYVEKMKPASEIAETLLNTKNNKGVIIDMLHEFKIPIRHGSEAVKTQWIDADERRAKHAKYAIENMHNESARKNYYLSLKSSERSKKISDSKRGKNNPMHGVIGEQHPNWNPKRTHEQRINERKLFVDSVWRKQVFERDEYKCQCCGDKRGGNLVAHHIESYNSHEDKRHDVSNGITLCEDCHKSFHGKYGYGNNNRQQFNEFMTKQINGD